MDDWITPTEAAAIIQRTRSRVHQLCTDGTLPFKWYKGGKLVSRQGAEKFAANPPPKGRPSTGRRVRRPAIAGRAYIALHRAVENGTLVRPITCGKCGSPGEVQAHHDDYSVPLAVEWLCRRCHRKLHPPKTSDLSCPKNRRNFFGYPLDNAEYLCYTHHRRKPEDRRPEMTKQTKAGEITISAKINHGTVWCETTLDGKSLGSVLPNYQALRPAINGQTWTHGTRDARIALTDAEKAELEAEVAAAQEELAASPKGLRNEREAMTAKIDGLHEEIAERKERAWERGDEHNGVVDDPALVAKVKAAREELAAWDTQHPEVAEAQKAERKERLNGRGSLADRIRRGVD